MTLVQVIDAGNGKNPELKMTKSEILFSNVDSFKVIDPVSFGFRWNGENRRNRQKRLTGETGETGETDETDETGETVEPAKPVKPVKCRAAEGHQCKSRSVRQPGCWQTDWPPYWVSFTIIATIVPYWMFNNAIQWCSLTVYRFVFCMVWPSQTARPYLTMTV
jgi:hypothetical protein